MDATSTLPWWIVECDGVRYPVQAPDERLAATYAAATHQLESPSKRWPNRVGTPHPATTSDIRQWGEYVAEVKRRADNDPGYTPTSLTETSLAHFPYALQVGESRHVETPDYRQPPTPLIRPGHLRFIFGNLLQLWAWVMVAIAPAVVSVLYWLGHNMGWWTVFGWDRTTGWFTNRSVIISYLLYGFIPLQTFWFLGWVLATDRWVDEHITTRPYFGGGIAGSKGMAR